MQKRKKMKTRNLNRWGPIFVDAVLFAACNCHSRGCCNFASLMAGRQALP